ncbi:transcription factor E2-alpha-like [Oryctolagus cuniculus]|uniref:transcription factor E2-alpha-like n=1 Tax=Oryctolagus cuniculus TaxID=9986 RepID=UPI00387A668E
MKHPQIIAPVGSDKVLSDLLEFSMMFLLPMASGKGWPVSLASAQFRGAGPENWPGSGSWDAGDQNTSSFDPDKSYSEGPTSVSPTAAFLGSHSWDLDLDLEAREASGRVPHLLERHGFWWLDSGQVPDWREGPPQPRAIVLPSQISRVAPSTMPPNLATLGAEPQVATGPTDQECPEDSISSSFLIVPSHLHLSLSDD